MNVKKTASHADSRTLGRFGAANHAGLSHPPPDAVSIQVRLVRNFAASTKTNSDRLPQASMVQIIGYWLGSRS